MSGCAVSDALLILLAGAIIIRRDEREWHSTTFSGRRLVVDLQTDADEAKLRAFATTIGEHEFSIADILVADVAVTDQHTLPDGATALRVEALLLEEDN
jgi:hypothetical protein